MAKYIKTKNEIGTFGGFRHNDFTGEVYTKVFNSHGTYREYTNIVAESDNIEELCDAYVGVYAEKENISDREIAYSISSLSGMDGFDEIYGAIWTDKGLIYVAKMNDNGELELL